MFFVDISSGYGAAFLLRTAVKSPIMPRTPAMEGEKGEAVREVYDGMGGDVEGAGLRRVTGLMLSRSNK